MSDSHPLQVLEQTWRPAVRLLAYYGTLMLAYVVLAVAFPWFGEQLSQVPSAIAGGLDLSENIVPSATSSAEAGAAAVLTMVGALLLALPIVWVYTFTRQRRGFQQSLAQTLIILPIVVAVVVILVKHSVALAFSLGGIVGAVAFRHRLEDTKDAVYIFVTIAIGLAVGMQAYSVAFAASVFYNLVALGLWATDFARAPAPLAAEIAQRRVRLAKGMSDKRTGEYVAQLDQHLLQSMTPDQLTALANRALEHSQRGQSEASRPPDALTSILVAAAPSAEGVLGLRATIEAVLDRDAKQWSQLADAPGVEGGIVLRYRVRCRKRTPPLVLLESVRHAAASLQAHLSLE